MKRRVTVKDGRVTKKRKNNSTHTTLPSTMSVYNVIQKDIGTGKIGSKAAKMGVSTRLSPSTVMSSAKKCNPQIVPWASRDEWERVCHLVNGGSWVSAVEDLMVWEQRVESLPLVTETTLFLLQAKIYDQKLIKELNHHHKYSNQQAIALYSLALIRYLNVAGHVAATAMGETTSIPTKELTANVGTPDWIVLLRNEVIHGTRVPSLETLRMSGDFILEWLLEHYWKLTNSEDSGEVINVEGNNRSIAEDSIGEIISAFVAVRIYKIRAVQFINDVQVTKHLKDKPRKAKTKAVIKELKSKILGLIRNNWELVCPVLAEAMIPTLEFYLDYKEILILKNAEADPFQQLVWIWNPLIKVLRTTKALSEVLLRLGEIHADENSNDEHRQQLSAKWIRRILDGLEEFGKRYSKECLQLLKIVMILPNSSSKLFITKLIKMLDSKLEHGTKLKCEMLASIWMDDRCPNVKAGTDDELFPIEDLFTVEDIQRQQYSQVQDVSGESDIHTQYQSTKFVQDFRSSNWWNDIPFGCILFD